MFERFPLASRFALWILIPLVLSLSAAFLSLRESLQLEHATLVIDSAFGQARVVSDDSVVPYITADSDAAAFYALGFVHARDRLWQMEIQRRLGQGRLSEIMGRATLSQDVWMRTLGLYESAGSSWNALSVEAKRSLTAYTAGVNAWIREDPVLPLEFYLLGVRPTAWRELDSLVLAKLFALSLAGNLSSEIRNFAASQQLDARELAELLDIRVAEIPQHAPALQNVAGALSAVARLQTGLASAWQVGGRYVGSNAWAVSGALSRSGAPLLANDVHMGLQIPSVWYVARMKGQSLDVSGMTLAGLPLVVFGRNPRIAWAGTNLMADVQDLYLEQVNPRDPTMYWTTQGWKRFDAHLEQVSVKADAPAFLRSPLKPVNVLVRRTRDGPVITGALPAAYITEQVVALRWTALEPGDASYEAFFRLSYAQDWAAFQQALSFLAAPALNFLYVDVKGNIGSIAAGRVPVRRTGQGQFPAAGWDGQGAWEKFIPFDALPRSFNPQSGFLVSANHNIAGPNYPYLISTDWALPYRAQRIEQLLQRGSKLSMQDMMSMQADTRDLSVERLVQHLKTLRSKDPRREAALDKLRAWHGEMSAENTAAPIFFVWMRHLRERLYAPKLTAYWNKPAQDQAIDAIVKDVSYDEILRALTASAPHWCARSDRSDGVLCREELDASLDQALDELTKLAGADMERWDWGRLHFSYFAHKPFGQSKLLAMLFERRLPAGGSPDTINVANANYSESIGYEQTLGAAFRQIFEMRQGTPRHAYLNSTGQSGNVLSAHYDDMAGPRAAGRYLELTEMRARDTRRPTVRVQ